MSFCSCCGAGVAADADVTTQMMSSNVELHSLSTGRPPLVVTVTRQLKQMLFRWDPTGEEERERIEKDVQKRGRVGRWGRCVCVHKSLV